MPDFPTLKDIAKKMGISVAAVSLGLRRAGNISEATCLQIEQTARAMGYRPNPHAAALSTRNGAGKSKGVPLAVLRRTLSGSADFYPIQAIVDGIVERAGALGYRVETFDVAKVGETPGLLKMLYNRGFQGIFVPPIGGNFRPEEFDWTPFSVVGCGRYDEASIFHTVRQEVFESTRSLFDHMIKRGYRRICMGLLLHDPPILDDYARIAVAEAANKTRGHSGKLFFSPPSQGYSDFAKWAIQQRADAVVGFSVGCYHELIQTGVKIPEDMAFVALHHYGESDTWIAGLSPRDKHCGAVAAIRMDAMIRHRERGIPDLADQIVIRSNWHPGRSLPESHDLCAPVTPLKSAITPEGN